LGITYLGLSTRAGQTWSSSNPHLARSVLIASTILLVLLALIVGVVLLLK
jgi:ABC-type lipoprotein release transport system permease subunit